MRCVVDYIFSVLFLTLYSVIRCCLPFQLMWSYTVTSKLATTIAMNFWSTWMGSLRTWTRTLALGVCWWLTTAVFITSSELRSYVLLGELKLVFFVCNDWQLCPFRGIKLIYLPPYSPNYNPIEECFSFIKVYIRRHEHTFRNIVETGDKIAPYHFLYEALDNVTPAVSRGWFHDSGYIWRRSFTS
jgi:hypothetical protein